MNLLRASSVRRIAAIYDIHGNLPALEAVLESVERQGIERIVVGGDIVLGPMPRETLQCLRAVGDRLSYVRGNCDRLVAERDAATLEKLPASTRAAVVWCSEQLNLEERGFLSGLPFSEALSVAGLGTVRFFHATARSDEEIVTERTSAARMQEAFGECTERLIVCGHTHMQFDRQVADLRIINAGSVGMPFDPPGAYWLELSETIRLHRTEFDVNAAARRVLATGYPDAVSFATNNVAKTPEKSAMLAAFERAG